MQVNIFFCLWKYICIIHEHGAHGGQKRVLLDPMGLDLWKLVSHHASDGNEPLSSPRSGSALALAIPPVPCMHFSKEYPEVDYRSCVTNFPG